MTSKAGMWLLALFATTVSMTTVRAEDGYFVNQRKEASMLVTGVVNLNPDGSVRDYTLDRPERLPAEAGDVIKQNVARWKFQFASPVSTVISEKMTLRLVARMIDDQHASVRLVGTSFDDVQVPEDERIAHKDQPRIEYPRQAIQERFWGTVYVLVRVGRDGSVQEATAEQVNLGAFAPAADMARYRNYLADAAVKGVRQSTYVVPTQGKSAGRPFWLVRIPVNFVPVGERPTDDYGVWRVYVPGPRMSIPWLEHTQLASDAPDTVPTGGLHTLGDQPQLAPESSGS
ncbi:energy transducer TonB [Dyella terrae]|uniref:energy transducer TonB n=1 Tax=Dyella terrae TaxID=522259 RepID=UPI001EFE2D6C|nr:energy transducer TonB [Dyella terrae]ULU25660.1 energy transducer TonB [Dyella terrae]